MRAVDEASADAVRSQIRAGRLAPAAFRTALLEVPWVDRDAWLDRVLGLEGLPEDGPDLPRGCAPYVPCPVDALLRVVEHARIDPSDVVVDVGAGLGRTAALVHLLTEASVIGIEVQRPLVRAAHALRRQLNVRFFPVEGDAVRLTRFVRIGSVFFLYCPFGGERFARVLDDLGDIAREREIRLCCVDMPVPPRPWLTRISPEDDDVAVFRSTNGSRDAAAAVRYPPPP